MRVLEEKPAPTIAPCSHFAPGEMDDEFLPGMYPREVSSEKSFRWSGWLCALLVHPPRDFTRVSISAHPFAPELLPGKDLLAYHDGIALTPVARQHEAFVFEASASSFPHGGPAWLTLVCRPFTAAGDSRALGLPIGEICYHRGNE
jgi:hypothetical protein